MTNTNYLEEFKCPKCGHEDSFLIAVQALVLVTDTSFDTSHIHSAGRDDDNDCRCPKCNYSATVAQFKRHPN